MLAKRGKRVQDCGMYSTFSNIEESIKLAWKHKLLWIFALMLVGGGIGSGSSFSSSSEALKPKDDNKPRIQAVAGSATSLVPTEVVVPVNTNEPEITGNVDVTTRDVGMDDFDMPSRIPAGMPPELLPVNQPTIMPTAPVPDASAIKSTIASLIPAMIVSTVLLFIVLLFWISVKVLISTWVKGGYYTGLLKACGGEEYGFKTLGDAGKSMWKRYLKLMIYFFYVRILTILPFTLLVIVYAAIGGFQRNTPASITIFALLAVATIVGAFVYNFLLFFVEQYALRLLVTDGLGTKAAFKMGWKYYRTRPGKSLKLFFALILVSMAALFILAVVGGSVASLFVLLAKQETPALVIGFLAIPLGLGIFLLSMVLAPMLNNTYAFSYTRLFLFIKESFVVKEAPTQETTILPQPEVAING